MVLAASMLSQALTGTVLRGPHAHVLDTIYLAAGVLAMLGGLYSMVMLRGVRLAGERGGPNEFPHAQSDRELIVATDTA